MLSPKALWVNMRSLWRSLITFLVPECCVICRTSGESLCSSCERSLRRPLDEFPSHISFYSYRDERVRRIVTRAKFYHVTSPLRKLASAAKKDFDRERPIGPVTFIPLPSPRKRILQRGVWPSLLIAKEIMSEGDILCTNVLFRLPSERQVTTHSRRERLKNVRNTFYVNKKGSLPPHPVILVDDVMTTGATLHEAKRTLEENGYSVLLTLTLTH